jgi:hypothetical protein
MPNQKLSDLDSYYDGNTHACVYDIFPVEKSACGALMDPDYTTSSDIRSGSDLFGCVRVEATRVCGKVTKLYSKPFYTSDPFIV